MSKPMDNVSAGAKAASAQMMLKLGPDYDDLPTGVVTCDMQGRLLSVNRRMLEWLGHPQADSLLGQPFDAILTEQSATQFRDEVHVELLTNGRVEEISVDLRLVSGRPRRIYLSGAVQVDADGAATGLSLICFDGTDRHNHGLALLAERRKAGAFEAIVEASVDAIIMIGPDRDVLAWNRAAQDLFGFTAQEAIGRKINELVVPDAELEGERDIIQQVAAGHSVRTEVMRRHKDGRLIPVEMSLARVAGEDGGFAGIAGLLRDISERRAAERLIETLNTEVLHRSKNLLAVVQGIARMTARHSAPEEFVPTFTRRLESLGTNLSLLVEQNWQDVALETLIRQQLAHVTSRASGRVNIAGPDLSLPHKTAEAIGMAVFELSTNAVKYGALKQPDGHVDVTWEIATKQPDHVVIHWRESGAKDVTSPTRKGFGTSLTGALLESATSGKVVADYQPNGLRWSLTLPAAPQA